MRQGLGEFCGAEPFELAHAHQRMLVGGVDVKWIVRDQTVEATELGDRFAQDPEGMHLEERFVDVSSRAEDGQQGGRELWVGAMVREEGEAFADELTRRRRNRDAVTLRFGEDVDQCCRLLPEDLAARDRERATLDVHPVADQAGGR